VLTTQFCRRRRWWWWIPLLGPAVHWYDQNLPAITSTTLSRLRCGHYDDADDDTKKLWLVIATKVMPQNDVSRAYTPRQVHNTTPMSDIVPLQLEALVVWFLLVNYSTWVNDWKNEAAGIPTNSSSNNNNNNENTPMVVVVVTTTKKKRGSTATDVVVTDDGTAYYQTMCDDLLERRPPHPSTVQQSWDAAILHEWNNTNHHQTGSKRGLMLEAGGTATAAVPVRKKR
jgi:hypothetical protein